MSKIESLENDIAHMEDIVATLDSLLESRGSVRVIELPPVSRTVPVIDAGQPARTQTVANVQSGNVVKQSAPVQSPVTEARPVNVQQPVIVSQATVVKQTAPEMKPAVVQQPAPEKKPEAVRQPVLESKPSAEPKPVVTQPSAQTTPALAAKSVNEPVLDTVELARDSQSADRLPKDCRESWQSLKIGMTKKQVQALMGDPDRRSERIIDYWCYVTSMGNAGYVYFNEGKLSGLGEPYIE